MKHWLLAILLILPIAAFSQTEPSQDFNSQYYRFKNTIRVDSGLVNGRQDTTNIRPSLLAPGYQVWRPQDQRIYIRDSVRFRGFSFSDEIPASVLDSLVAQNLQRVTNKGANSTNKIRLGDGTAPTHQLDVVGVTGPAATSGDAENGILKIVGRNTNRSLVFGFDTMRNEAWVQPRNGNDYGINYNIRIVPNGGRMLIGRQQIFDTTTQSIRNLFIQTDEANTGTRIYVVPNGTVSGTRSGIKFFGTNYLADIVNYDDFNIVNHDTAVWFNHKKNGSGVNKDMIFMYNDAQFKVLTIRAGTRNILVNGAPDDAVFSVRAHTSEGVNATLPILKLSSGLNVPRLTVLNNGLVGVGSTAPTSTMLVNGSFATAIASVSANTTLDATHSTVRVTTSGVTITFPAASTCTGRIYRIINYNTGGNITTSAWLSLTGVSTTTIGNGIAVWVQSDGTNWYRINN